MARAGTELLSWWQVPETPALRCSCPGAAVYCHERSLASVPAGIPTTTRELLLYTNQITKLEPGVFDSLTAQVETRDTEAPAIANAIHLYLERNQLSALPVGLFDKLTQLTYLSLHINQLKSVPRGALHTNQLFDRLMTLKELYLYKNQLKSLTTGVFDKLTQLMKMSLRNNHLKSIPDSLYINTIVQHRGQLNSDTNIDTF
ncbi:unnamed protein product [Lampetra planeri]